MENDLNFDLVLSAPFLALSGAQPQVRLAPSYLTMAGGVLSHGGTPKSSKSLPSGYVKIAIENSPFIVDLPMKNGGSFHSYVSLPEGRPF